MFSPRLASGIRAHNDQAELSQGNSVFMARTRSCTRRLAARISDDRIAAANLSAAPSDALRHGTFNVFPANSFGRRAARAASVRANENAALDPKTRLKQELWDSQHRNTMLPAQR